MPFFGPAFELKVPDTGSVGNYQGFWLLNALIDTDKMV